MAKNSARSHRKNNRFSQIPNSPIQRSVFDRSHDYKTTLYSGYLIPFFVDEVLPGDTFKLRVNAFVRMNTLISPFMDNVFMDSLLSLICLIIGLATPPFIFSSLSSTLYTYIYFIANPSR